MDFFIKKWYYHFGFFWNNLTKKLVFAKKLFWVLVIGFLNLVSVDAKERSNIANLHSKSCSFLTKVSSLLKFRILLLPMAIPKFAKIADFGSWAEVFCSFCPLLIKYKMVKLFDVFSKIQVQGCITSLMKTESVGPRKNI